MFAQLVKNTVILFALVDPLTLVPLFLFSAREASLTEKLGFARTLGLAVTAALAIAGLIGNYLLSLLGLSLGSMQVGGGIIALMLGIAMALGKEENLKGSPPSPAVASLSIVPLAIPLMAGPAAMAFMMTSAHGATWQELLMTALIPPFLLGVSTWLIFKAACHSEKWMSQSTLSVLERLAGFLLTVLSIEMMANGLKSLFPALGG